MIPNLLIAGAQKSGTTWLHRMLAKHPDFAMSRPKELEHLRRREPEFTDGWENYLARWEGRTERFRGESTPHYFRAPERFVPGEWPAVDVAQRVADHLGDDTQIVVILRDPVSRAVSGYWHNFSRGRFDPQTTSIFRCPPSQNIIELGFYQQHYEHWARVLDPARIHVMLYDDLVADPDAFLRAVLTRLGARVDVPEYWAKANPSKRIHDKAWVKEFRAAHNPITAIEVAALLAVYRPTIAWAEEFFGRELPRWKDLGGLVSTHSAGRRGPGPWVLDPASVPELAAVMEG